MRRWLLALALVAASSCKDTHTPVGEIVLAIQTDVALPDSVDRVRVEVSSFGNLVFGNDYEVGQGKLLIPATLGLLAGSKPGDPILIRVIAKKNGAVKMLREVTTPIPPDRIVTLRVPIRWLCDDSGKETSPGTYANAICPSGQTCIGGDCHDLAHDTANDSNDSSGVCFDVIKCLEGAIAVTPEPTTCTIPRPADPGRFNVGLAVENDGICSGGKCFVVLDRTPDETKNPPEGWTTAPGAVQLPHAVCTRLASSRVKQVVTSTTCAAKTDRDAPCGSWSSVQGPTTPPTVTPPTQGTLTQEPGRQIITASCPMVLVGTNLFWCTAPATYVTDLVVVPAATGGVPSKVQRLGNQGDFAGAIVATDRIYALTRTQVPLVVTLYEIFGTTSSNVGLLQSPQTTWALPLDYRHAVDAARVYFGGILPQSPIYAAPRTAGSVTRIANNLTGPFIGIGSIVADADPINGFVYATLIGDQGGSKGQIVRSPKAGVDNVADVVVQLSTGRAKDLLLDGSSLLYIAIDTPLKGPSSIQRAPITVGAVPVDVYPGLADANELTLDGDTLYWLAKSSFGDVGVFKAPKAGGAVPTLLAHEPEIVTLAVGDAVYYGVNELGGAMPSYHVVRTPK